jgi:hypothetical protein
MSNTATETDVLAANIAAFTRAQPGFVAPLSSSSVRLIDGAWRLVEHGGARAIHGRNPQRDADRTLADLLGQSSPDMLVVVGLGLGFLLDALERRGWTGKVLAIEPEPDTVTPFLARRDWRPWITEGRLRLLVAPDFMGAGECWKWFAGGAECAVFVNPVFARLRPAAVGRAETVLGRIRFDAEANEKARNQHGGRYLLNTLANIPALAREGDAAALTGATNGFPAIVVAAGPSLDENVAPLREVGERAVLITVDTALRPLLAAGIAPHIVVAVDPSDANARHLVGLPRCPDTHLVAEASLDPGAVHGFRGRTFLFSVGDHQPWPWLAAHGAARGRLRAWGSVLTSAFDLALQMGCNPVVFAGADLAFTGYRPYARGVIYELDWRRLAEWGTPYEEYWRQQVDAWPHTEESGVDGAPVRTTPNLIAFRNWLVEQTTRSDRQFINATGAGILHGGRLIQKSMQEVVAELPRNAASPRKLVRARYAPVENAALLEAASLLQTAPDEPLASWERFADGLTRASMLDAVARALGAPSPGPAIAPAPSTRATAEFDAFWAERIAANLPMVALPIPPDRMEPRASGSRVFRFRTTTARLIGCVLRLPDNSVTEDGRPLRRAGDMDNVAAGECFVWRDEIHIASSDGTDPRHNGRLYAVLVPEAIAYIEGLPIDEILRHHL